MPNPTPDTIHIDQFLTDISVAYIQEASVFVANRVFPSVAVQKQSNKYVVHDRASFLRSEMKPRARATEAALAEHKYSSDRYECEEFALATYLADQDRVNQDNPIKLEIDKARYLAHQALLHREKKFAQSFFTTGLWTDKAAPADLDKFTNAAGNPISDIRELKREMLQNTGFMPNRLLLGRAAADALLDHPDIIERVVYNPRDGVAKTSMSEVASLFELEEILVLNAIENTAREGATEDNNFILGTEDALLYYAPRQSGLYVPSAGYTFDWAGMNASYSQAQAITRWRDERKRADFFEINDAFDMKVVAADLGMFLTDVGAP